MIDERLPFTVNAKVEQLLGRDLITNRNIAVFELIKNSYDAGATTVTIRLKGFNHKVKQLKGKSTIISPKDSSSIIEIEDDGCGMDYNEIKSNWLQIGTTAKETQTDRRVKRDIIDENISLPYLDRILNGEKGIGRLGTDKLGAVLVLDSISNREPEVVHSLEIRWNEYNDHAKTIDQIMNDYKVNRNTQRNPGLKLTIKNLREDWLLKDYEGLVRSLKKLIPPSVVSIPNFHIMIEIFTNANDQTPNQRFEIENDTFGYLHTYIEANTNSKGLVKYDIIYKGEKRESDSYIINYERKEENFGKTVFKAYYLDYDDKRTFSRQMGIRVVDYGNIRVYRDHFRVMPYGEPHNDWLEIDRKHSQGIFRSLGTRDLVGYVQISKLEEWGNSELKDATNRLGLVEDIPAFSALKNLFLVPILDKLRDFIFKRIEEESLSEASKIRIKASQFQEYFNSDMLKISDSIKHLSISESDRGLLETQINNARTRFIKPVAQIARMSEAIDKRVKLLANMVSSEELLYKLFHEVKIRLHFIKADVIMKSKHHPSIDWDPMRSNIKQMEEIIVYAANSVNPLLLPTEHINIHNFVSAFIRDITPRLAIENIELVYNVGEDSYSQLVGISRKALEIVMSNLIDNAIKALANTTEKHIIVSLDIVEVDRVILCVSDTGIGIPQEVKPTLFSLGSTSTSQFGGLGIGLTFVKSILDKAGASIALQDNPVEGCQTTFKITLKGKNNG